MPDVSWIEQELRLRLAAMAWLDRFDEDHGFRYAELAEFRFDGRPVPLLDYTRGIRKPKSMRAALSFRTVFTPAGSAPPYADEAGADGLLRYKIRGTDRDHPENVALRTAMNVKAPLIWFVGVSSGVYLARYPVFLVSEEPDLHQFVVALDEFQLHTAASHHDASADERAYAERIARQRLHQPLFRARVLEAYEQRCALCRLGHVPLLDASHIVSDRHDLGQPVVPNGLALCKIHHAAFDRNIIGVRPDLVTTIRKDILIEIDGPMLKHGIQEMDGVRITVPRQLQARPDRDRLALRYAEFLAAEPRPA